MSAKGRNGTVWLRTLLIVAMALRALVPVGYMPVALDSGVPLAVCPVASPGLHRWIAAMHAEAADVHAHHQAHVHHRDHGAAPASDEDGSAAASSCPFAAWLSTPPLGAGAVAAVPGFSSLTRDFAPVRSRHLRSLARLTTRARGPPHA